MLIPANSEFAPPADNRDEIAIGDLLDRLAEHSEAALVFYYDGRPVKPGYHVTEVKAGQFAALDCGANAEAWTEIFIQLWDVEEGQRSHMKAGKFAAIIRKVAEHVSLEKSGRCSSIAPALLRFPTVKFVSICRLGRRAASRGTVGLRNKRARRRAPVAD